MTDGTLHIDRPTLRACSDALFGVGLWAGAARLGELSSPPDGADALWQLEVAWRLWRAGRPEAALARMAELPDATHPVLPALCAAAVATRDRTPDALAALLRETSALAPDALVLRMVAHAAVIVGDRVVALDAAARFLATIDADDATMRRIVAPAQARDGEIDAAVTSTEWARAGRPGDPDRPVHEIVAELRQDGRDDAAVRLLADAFIRTGRPVYGELLAGMLPPRLRFRERGMLLGLLVAVAAVPALVGFGPPVGPVVAVLLGVAGIAVFAWAATMRAEGADLEQTNRVSKAATVHGRRSGTFSLWNPVVAAALLAMGFAAFVTLLSLRRGIPPEAVALLVASVLPATAVTAAGAALNRHVRRRRAAAAEQAARVPVDRCRCWERDWFAGPTWHAYGVEHLVPAAADPGSGVVLRRCPTTGTTWLYAADAELLARVRIPESAEQEELPTGAYL
jgi:hypothetical protein